jgi:SAM-dependent methyltransferase
MISESEVIKQPEIKQNLITTLNQKGYMLVKPEHYMQSFIDFSGEISDPVLDIGAAYGVATIPALEKGAHVVANDIDERHLAILKSKVPPSLLSQLELKQGNMPTDLDFPENYFGAILASRIFSFVEPRFLKESMSLIYKWLKPGGKFFYLGGSPYMGTFKSFLPQYHKNKKEQHPWPGHIENLSVIAPSYAHQLPSFIHLIDEEVLQRLLKEAGFEVQEMAYVAAEDDHPEDMKLDGRTFLGAIAIKP